MSGRVSPFAALTGDERQIKWLEMQTVRLPYVDAALELPGEDGRPEPPKRREAGPADGHAEPARQAAAAQASQKPAGEDARRAEFARARHAQYDAVLKRMRQAERQTNGYMPLS